MRRVLVVLLRIPGMAPEMSYLFPCLIFQGTATMLSILPTVKIVKAISKLPYTQSSACTLRDLLKAQQLFIVILSRVLRFLLRAQWRIKLRCSSVGSVLA